MAVQKYDIRRPEREDGGFEVRYWSLRNSPVLDENKRLKYVIHRVQDVSDYVPLHQRESQHEREIVNRSQEQRTNEQLRAANSAKNDFLSRMSHALRSPLGAIMGFGQLLEFGELDDQQREYANAIKYNRRGGDVRVAVTGAADERVRVSVADLGHGIEQTSLEKLRRARRSRRAFGGDRSAALSAVVRRRRAPAALHRGHGREREGDRGPPRAAPEHQADSGDARPTRPRPCARAPAASRSARPPPAGSLGRQGALGASRGRGHARDSRRDPEREREQFLAAGAPQAYLTKPIDLRRLLEILGQFLAPDREPAPVSVQ